MAQEHINESILSEEILEDQKKNRIDHMTYLPGMEAIKSDVMDQVVAAAKAYDYDSNIICHCLQLIYRINGIFQRLGISLYRF